jgi:hypothetical protein
VHRLIAAVTTAALLAGPLARPLSAGAEPSATLSVDGAVAAPASYTLDDLAALPQTTEAVSTPGPHGPVLHVDEGVTLETLVTLASPTLPVAKNALLRIVVTVTGDDATRTFALGELDPNFGNHGALVAIDQDGRLLDDGPELVVPGDTTAGRFVRRVRRVVVGVESPTPSAPPSGAIDVVTSSRSTELSAADLEALPSETLSVAFVAGTATQHHVESGPTLASVLAAADVRTGPDAWVAAVGSDGYVATVTPAEARIGGRPLLISLSEDGVPLARPRLVADGDVKGGRYVSLLVDLVIGRGAVPGRFGADD